MKQWFNTEEEALEYKEQRKIFGLVHEPDGTGRWILVFPIKAHVTVHQPHSPR